MSARPSVPLSVCLSVPIDCITWLPLWLFQAITYRPEIWWDDAWSRSAMLGHFCAFRGSLKCFMIGLGQVGGTTLPCLCLCRGRAYFLLNRDLSITRHDQHYIIPQKCDKFTHCLAGRKKHFFSWDQFVIACRELSTHSSESLTKTTVSHA